MLSIFTLLYNRGFSSCNTETLYSTHQNYSPSASSHLSNHLPLCFDDFDDFRYFVWVESTVFVLFPNTFFFFICVLHCSQAQHPLISNISSYTEKGEGEMTANAHTAESWVGIHAELGKAL